MTYTLTATTNIIRDADKANIPADPNNADYQAYEIWIAEGNTPNPYIAPNMLPSQAQAALNKSDVTVLRCISAGVVVPTEWQTYRIALRYIINGTDTSSTYLPTVPEYPSGT